MFIYLICGQADREVFEEAERKRAAARAAKHAAFARGVVDQLVDLAAPPPRTNRTRRVPHPALIGHAASLSQVDLGRVLSAAGCNAFAVWALPPPSLPY